MFGYSIKPKSQNPSTSFDPRWELLPWPPGRRNERMSPREKIRSMLSYQCAAKKKFSVKDQKKNKRKCSRSKIGRKTKEKRKSPIKDRNKKKEIYIKVFKPGNIRTIWNCYEQMTKERKPRLKVALSFWLPTQNTMRWRLSRPALNRNKKRNKPKRSKPSFPLNTVSQQRSYYSMITHVIFDLIGNDLQNQFMTYPWFGIRMKHLPVWGLCTLSDFLLFFVRPSVSSKWSIL